MPNPSQSDERKIRVFISSTFRDMQAERDELVKRVFPQLRKLCEQRGVTWGEVDLRWGVTEEQNAEGRLLPICLEEIRRCRPYFIGLLGERYGWIPEALPAELVESEAWLADLRGHSVTELEILHGVLNDPAMAEHALFYFRDPAYLKSLPESEQADFIELPGAQEVQAYGPEEARRRADDRRLKLALLKERIRASGLPLHENYPDPVSLGEWVLRDMTALIDRLYPAGSPPDLLDREAFEHEAFASSRVGVYIGRPADYARLDAHAEGKGPPLVVLGESGMGKSALLANWAMRFRRAHPEILLIMHFIGASPASVDWAAMLRRILGELKRHFDLPGEIPDQPEALRAAFANSLNMAAARGMLVLILDALNQLEDREGAVDLAWLPPVIPDGVRLVLSTLPGRPVEEIRKRGWPTLQVQALEPDERRQLIQAYLAQFSKALNAERTRRIADAPQSSNPLYLRVLLDELRLFGMHERLDERIRHYLTAATPNGLYEKVLERCEQDYERGRPGLVRDAMTWLWAARRGLSEAELLELLGTQGLPLPGAFSSPFFLALKGSLVDRGGLIGFAHAYLRQAVRDRYLASAQEQSAAHMHLAFYFNKPEMYPREIDELPWQLAQAEDWHRLASVLANLPFFRAAWRLDPFEVKAYWTQIEHATSLRMLEIYQPVFSAPGEALDSLREIGNLCRDTGHPEQALVLETHLLEHYRQQGDQIEIQACLADLTLIHYMHGELEQALQLSMEQERICRRMGFQVGLAGALVNQANVHQTRGENERALALLKESEGIYRALGDRQGEAISIGNQANILYPRGDVEGALRLRAEEQRIYRELGDKDGLQRNLGNLAGNHINRGELDKAQALLDEAEQICRALGNQDGLQRQLMLKAQVCKIRGDLEGAMRIYQESERICQALGNKSGLQAVLGLQGKLLSVHGDWSGALELHRRAERLCREIGDHTSLQSALFSQAMVLYQQGELDASLALSQESEQICREIGNKDALASTLAGQATIHQVRGDLESAMTLYRQAEVLLREVGNKDELRINLSSQGLIWMQRGELQTAGALFEEEARLSRAIGNIDGLSYACHHLGEVRRMLGDREGALELYAQAETLARQVGDKDQLRGVLGSRGLVLADSGDREGALELFAEEERLCRELGNRNGLQISLGSQADNHYWRGEMDRALALYREQEQICRELGKKDELANALLNQGLILQMRRDLDGLARLYAEAGELSRTLESRKTKRALLGGQAWLQAERGNLEEALRLRREEERLCREINDPRALQICLGFQANLLLRRSQAGAALELYREQERICRQIDDRESLVRCLANQALTLGTRLNDPQKALQLAEQARRLATENGLSSLLVSIASIRREIQTRPE